MIALGISSRRNRLNLIFIAQFSSRGAAVSSVAPEVFGEICIESQSAKVVLRGVLSTMSYGVPSVGAVLCRSYLMTVRKPQCSMVCAMCHSRRVQSCGMGHSIVFETDEVSNYKFHVHVELKTQLSRRGPVSGRYSIVLARRGDETYVHSTQRYP